MVTKKYTNSRLGVDLGVAYHPEDVQGLRQTSPNEIEVTINSAGERLTYKFAGDKAAFDAARREASEARSAKNESN
jgi:hypothetical protein